MRPAKALRPEDFAALRAALSKSYNPTSLANILVRIRSIFTWGVKTGLLDRNPRYGTEFALPSAKARRRARRERGSTMFEPWEIHKVLDAANRNMRGMILLGVNCGFGNTDCSEVLWGHIDLEGGILDFPRPKTEANRRCALWAETVEALQQVLDFGRSDDRGRVFVTERGAPYVRDRGAAQIDGIGQVFGKLQRRVGVCRSGRGFYGLRHTFRTVADETRDWPVIDLCMGHIPSDAGAPFSVSMADRYRERISDDRLREVAEHVRDWLWK
jgi:integrase